MIGVRTAETMTTSSAELVNNLALPKDGMAEVILCSVEDMALVADPILVLDSIVDE